MMKKLLVAASSKMATLIMGGEVAEDREEEEEEEREVQDSVAEGFHEAEAILRKRIRKGVPQYLIKWRNTWEPVEHLQTCPDLVEEFEKRLSSGLKNSRKSSKLTLENEPPNPIGNESCGPNTSERDFETPYPNPSYQSKANRNKLRGAKRRNSGFVRQDTTSFNLDCTGNTIRGTIRSCNRVEQSMLGNSDLPPGTNIVRDVSSTFLSMRSDANEVMVDNKLRKANNPQLKAKHPSKRKLENGRKFEAAGPIVEYGLRRSTRIKMRPLEYWNGERLLYGRVRDSMLTLIGVKHACPSKEGGQNRTLKVKSFVSDEYKELVDFVALH